MQVAHDNRTDEEKPRYSPPNEDRLQARSPDIRDEPTRISLRSPIICDLERRTQHMGYFAEDTYP